MNYKKMSITMNYPCLNYIENFKINTRNFRYYEEKNRTNFSDILAKFKQAFLLSRKVYIFGRFAFYCFFLYIAL